MSAAILGALSALFGTALGGVLAYYTTRFTTTEQHRHSLRMREIEKREQLYSDFIGEHTRLIVLNVDKGCPVGELTKLISLQAQIKIISSEDVCKAGEQTLKELMADIIERDERKTLPKEATTKPNLAIRAFIDTARAELERLKSLV